MKYGGDIAVGAMTILTSVMQFAMLPLQGLGQGAQPIISYNYGARNVERVKKAFWLLLKVSMAYAVLLWGGVILFPQGFASLFTSDTALLVFTKDALRIYVAALFIFGIQMACQMTFMSIGNAKAFYYRSGYAQIYSFNSTDLCDACSFKTEPDYGSLYGRTCGRHNCRDIYRNFICIPV